MKAPLSLIEQVFTAGDRGDVSRFGALLHEDVVVHAPFGLSTVGVDAECDSWRRATLAMPDLEHKFHTVIRDQQYEAAFCVVTGTLVGDYGGLRATGASFRVEQALFARVHDGRIAELWEVVDTESLLRQLQPRGEP